MNPDDYIYDYDYRKSADDYMARLCEKEGGWVDAYSYYEKRRPDLWDIDSDDIDNWMAHTKKAIVVDNPNITGACMLAKKKAQWVGALVQMKMVPRSAKGPRSYVPDGSVGTVIDIEVNYKDQTLAQIMWADAEISVENVIDLTIVGPPAQV